MLKRPANRKLAYRFVLATAAVLLVGPLLSQPSSASSDTSQGVKLSSGRQVSVDPSRRSSADEAAFRDEVNDLAAHGKFDKAAMSRLGLKLMSQPEDPSMQKLLVGEGQELTEDKQAAEATAASTCGSVNAPGSSAAGMTLGRPTITMSSSSQGYVLYGTGTFQWTSPPTNWTNNCERPVGGADGFAIALNRAATNIGVSWSVCDTYYPYPCVNNMGWLETNNSYGFGFAFQDWTKVNATSPKNRTGKGAITYSFRTSTAVCTQAFTKYGHTWSSTSLNGFSIGPWSIGVQWSSTSNYWQKSSTAGSFGTC